MPSGQPKYYAVQVDRVPGVYTDWPTASAQLNGVKRPRQKRFDTFAEAEAFVAEGKKGSLAAAVAAAQRLDKQQQLAASVAAPAGMILQDNQRDLEGNIYEPGTGPFPQDAEDGFDPNITLDANGQLVYKTNAEKTKTKVVPKAASDMLIVYTDGSSLSNGTVGASAGVGVYFGPGDRKNVSEPLSGTRQTNQRAELTAILRALDITPRHREVTIYTDSRYSIDCVTSWYKNWKRNGWLTATKKPVENRDLIQEIRAKMEEREGLGKGSYFVWVKGHNGDRGNVEADRLAIEGARMGRGAVAASSISGTSTIRGEQHARTEEEGLFEAMDRAMQEEEERTDNRSKKTPKLRNGF